MELLSSCGPRFYASTFLQQEIGSPLNVLPQENKIILHRRMSDLSVLPQSYHSQSYHRRMSDLLQDLLQENVSLTTGECQICIHLLKKNLGLQQQAVFSQCLLAPVFTFHSAGQERQCRYIEWEVTNHNSFHISGRVFWQGQAF